MSSPESGEVNCSSGENSLSSAKVDDEAMARRGKYELTKADNSGDIKVEPKDDIKNFAEDTMNELLGWYGYEKASGMSLERKMKLKKHHGDRDQALRFSQSQADGDDTRTNDSNDSCGASKSEQEHRMLNAAESLSEQPPTLPKENHDTEAGRVTELPEKCFVVCTWCQKGKTLDKHYVMTTKEGERKFCSEQCFSQCRREKYKKQKVCEWCKGACIASKCVEFEDGGDTFLFCSDGCLNKYKMDIFCQETQEHMKRSQGDGEAIPATSSAPRILITPELWVQEMSHNASKNQWVDSRRKLVDTTNKMRSLSEAMPHHDKARHKNKHASHSPTSDYEGSTNSMLRVVALKAKAELEHPKASRASANSRPPRMTDREKIKQIRMRDKLPLHTPLRETYRGHTHSDMFCVQNLTRERYSPESSNPVFSSTSQTLSQALPISSGLSQMSPMSVNHLFGALAANHGSRPISSHSVSPKLERCRENGDSCSSQSTSPRISSTEQGPIDTTPAPPLYPPPNPFTQALPSYFNLPNGPLPFPPTIPPPSLATLSALNGIYPPPFLPTAMTNIMPPNTLMMPYPFVLPLPIPIPIPIPIPQKLIEKLHNDKNVSSGSQNENSDNDSKENIFLKSGCKNGCANNSGSHTNRPSDDHAPCSCHSAMFKDDTRRRHSASPNEQSHRYFLDSKKQSDGETDRAIDLSTDSGRFRPKSMSPGSANMKSGVAPSPVVIQPTSDTGSELSPGPATSPFSLNPVVNCSNPRYSSRRSLILDAPTAVNESVRSPSPAEKRSYNGASVRDILYGKRKCVRPRIKTK